MKHKKYFWGIFFIALGAFALLLKYDFIEADLSSLINYWPVIFILWGLAIISKDTFFRPIVSSLTAIFIVLLIISFFQYIFNDDHFRIELSDNYSSSYSYNIDDSLETASLEFDSGLGTFQIGGSTVQLFEAKSKTKDLRYDFDVYQSNKRANIDLSLEGKDEINSSFENLVEMRLNKKPVWDLELNLGASKAEVDLSEYKIKNLEINSGASTLNVKLGNQHSLTYVTGNIGVVKLNLAIPQNSGCRVKFNQFMISKDLDGFIKVRDGVYETRDYELSENKIIMDFEGGVSTFNVTRY